MKQTVREYFAQPLNSFQSGRTRKTGDTDKGNNGDRKWLTVKLPTKYSKDGMKPVEFISL